MNKHKEYYISLLAILFVGFLIAYNSPNKQFQFMVVVVTAFFYAFWGVLHHFINHELTPKIMIEYVLIGLLGISILFFFIMGGLI